MYYLESESKDPYYNLALEEYVFEELSANDDFFMLWQNDNTVVVGKYQNTIEEINREYVKKNGINVVRRMSGGGAVYHDRGNLNYTFIVRQGMKDGFDFTGFTKHIIKALKELDIKAEFTGRNDVTIDGKKICGTAQYARNQKIMHHGCIMVDSNLVNVADALNPNKMKFESKSIKSVKSRVTTINACTDSCITVDIFKDVLKKQIFSGNKIEKYILTEEDIARVKKLRDEKYITWEWNYGESPQYDFEVEHKFEYGMVSLKGKVKDGIIEKMRIYGDFFGNEPVEQLENALVGEKIDNNLEKSIEGKTDTGLYINGMTASDLGKLLRGEL